MLFKDTINMINTITDHRSKLVDVQPHICTGDFTCNILDKDKKIIRSINEHNLVVNTSKAILAALLGGAGNPITLIGLGTGTTEASLTDTGLTNTQYYAITGVSFPNSIEWVQFNWYIGYGELVGWDISEFGLFTSTHAMFSRKVYDPIPKSADMAFDGQWVIKFFQE